MEVKQDGAGCALGGIVHKTADLPGTRVALPPAMLELHRATDSMPARLDRLTESLTTTVAGLEPEKLDALLSSVLQQAGESLGADQMVFETVLAGAPGGTLRRNWNRLGALMIGEPLVIVPLSGRSGALRVLAITGDRDCAWAALAAERLRPIADLLDLAVGRCELMGAVERLKSELADRMAPLPRRIIDEGDPSDFEDIIGESPALRRAIDRVKEVAPTDASVVLIGETGTGKELFARALHERSTRRDRPFVRVNCAALPSTLIESELFGHERGAFTGAVAARQGRFEIAHRGTLFLDEIGDLAMEVQAKLLRVLQEGEFERVGSSLSRKVDVRVVAATHHDLELAVKEGRFRPDLYYRLNVYPITLPPLRDRLEDLPRLVWYFINRRQRALNRRFSDVPASVFAALEQYAWPGNVRELANVIERAMIHSSGTTLRLDETQRLADGTGRPAGSETLEAVERCHIEEALRKSGWRINGSGNAAEMLGLHPNTLRFRMKKLGVQRPAKGGGAPLALGRRSA
jgi:transcriptional regulator with GAF, ATPase, and Fis domain